VTLHSAMNVGRRQATEAARELGSGTPTLGQRDYCAKLRTEAENILGLSPEQGFVPLSGLFTALADLLEAGGPLPDADPAWLERTLQFRARVPLQAFHGCEPLLTLSRREHQHLEGGRAQNAIERALLELVEVGDPQFSILPTNPWWKTTQGRRTPAEAEARLAEIAQILRAYAPNVASLRPIAEPAGSGATNASRNG
jgi:hypothetical protein